MWSGFPTGSTDGAGEGLRRRAAEARRRQGDARCLCRRPASPVPPALVAPAIDGGRIKVKALRAALESPAEQTVRALAGNGRSLAEANLAFSAKSPARPRPSSNCRWNFATKPQRIEIARLRASASGVYLLDDRWRRKTVGCRGFVAIEASQPLLSPLFYVSRALEPYAELSKPGDRRRRSKDSSNAGPLDAGPGRYRRHRRGRARGGEGLGRARRRAPALRRAPARGRRRTISSPCAIREGGRTLGSALSWETPQALQAFAESSVFAGVALDPDVRVNAPGAGRARRRTARQGLGLASPTARRSSPARSAARAW